LASNGLRRADPRRLARIFRIRKEFLVLLGAFLVGTGVALLAGAKNLGTGLTFGQIAFAGAVVFVLLRRGGASERRGGRS
jgi:hypothetical protein